MDLFTAARSGDLKALNELILAGHSLNEKNQLGHSPLMIAAYNGHYGAVDLLIKHGADVNSTDNSGNSIIMGVVFKGHSPIFDLLIKSGASLENLNNKKQSALDLAVMFGKRNLIFKINKLLNTNRSEGPVEQIKTWAKQILPEM